MDQWYMGQAIQFEGGDMTVPVGAAAGAAGLTAVGSFNTGTGAVGTTISVSTGFAPKVVFFFWTGASSSGIARMDSRLGRGAAIGPSDRFAIDTYSRDTVGTSVESKTHRNDCAVCQLNDMTINGRLDVQSFGSSGFVMEVDQQFGADMRVAYLALGGDNLQVALGFFNNPGTNGNFDVNVGFAPEALVLAGVNQVGLTYNTVYAITQLNMGFAATVGNASSQEYNLQIRSSDNSGNSSVSGANYSGQIARNGTNNGVASFLANGFRITWSLNGSVTDRYSYVALGGVSAYCGVFTANTSLSGGSESGFGFTPEAIIFLSARHSGNLGSSSTINHSIIGFANAQEQRGATWYHRTGQTNMQVGNYFSEQSVYSSLDTSHALNGELAVTSLDSDGFSWTMLDAESSAYEIFYLALGPFT
jgi:hypothetical protein